MSASEVMTSSPSASTHGDEVSMSEWRKTIIGRTKNGAKIAPKISSVGASKRFDAERAKIKKRNLHESKERENLVRMRSPAPLWSKAFVVN